MEIQKPIRQLYHVVEGELIEIDIPDGKPIELIDGDVYVYDIGSKIWIWIGKDSTVDEHTSAAYLTNKIDHLRGGVPDVQTINEGFEPEEFSSSLNFVVIDGDTPGFLKKAVLDEVELKMYRVWIDRDTEALDETMTEEVEISRSTLTSDDVFVLDANEKLYCYIGKNCQLEERIRGQKVMQEIDRDRNYMPKQYTVYEGEGDSTEREFYKVIAHIEKLDNKVVTSVEDFRELEYRPEDAQTADEAKKQDDEEFKDASTTDTGYKSSENLKSELEYEEEKGSDASRMGEVMAEKKETGSDISNSSTDESSE